jgi:hypothetical protein
MFKEGTACMAGNYDDNPADHPLSYGPARQSGRGSGRFTGTANLVAPDFLV